MAASWMKDVFSSTAIQVGYDDKTKELLVKWKNGKVSAYAEVPEPLAELLSKAPSVGTMLNTDIKPFYQHRYVHL